MVWESITFTCWNESLIGVLTSIRGSALVILSRCCWYLFCSHWPVKRSCLLDCRKHLVFVPISMSSILVALIHSKTKFKLECLTLQFVKVLKFLYISQSFYTSVLCIMNGTVYCILALYTFLQR